MTYILTPPQIRNNPAPEYKIKNWGLTDKIVDDLHKWVEEYQPLQKAGYVTEGNDEHDDCINGAAKAHQERGEIHGLSIL